MEKLVSSSEIYNGVIVKLKKDTVIGNDGKEHTREVINHPGGVVIAGILNEKEIILIKQWRYPVSGWLIELPAGKLNFGEDHLEAAKREFEEETGYISKDWEYKGFVYSTPGFCDEKLHFYIARNLVKTQTNFDSGEIIEPYIINIKDALQMAQNGKIQDAKTIIGLHYLKTE